MNEESDDDRIIYINDILNKKRSSETVISPDILVP